MATFSTVVWRYLLVSTFCQVVSACDSWCYWYSYWYTWFLISLGIIALFVIITAIAVCCQKKRKREAEVRTLHTTEAVVTPPPNGWYAMDYNPQYPYAASSYLGSSSPPYPSAPGGGYLGPYAMYGVAPPPYSAEMEKQPVPNTAMTSTAGTPMEHS